VPLVGFLPPDDERVIATVDGIDEELVVEGFVRRYVSRSDLDGLPAGEGTFLMCSFWMAQAKAVIGRQDEARSLFERLLAVRNDVGLLSEQYDPVARRMLGNMPQAFSHTALVNTAVTLNDARAAERAGSTPAAANPRQPR
jgi:GH15 family glucan-1,4-alpha-glucosidase